MKFKGKIDLWIWIIMLAGEAMVLFALLGEDGPSVVGFLTALIYNLAFLPFVIRNYVEIKEGKVTVAFGFIKQSIALYEILEVYRTNNPVSSSAASVDRLVIQGENKQLIFAVKDKEGFLTALKEQNPAIKIPNVDEKPKKSKIGKISSRFAWILMGLVAILLLTGEIKTEFKEDSFVIKATYWYNKEIAYDEIESMEYRDEKVEGSRVAGFASFRLLMGDFNNEELGNYTRYTYTKCDAGIILLVNGREVVLSGSDKESTKAIYEELIERCK